MVSENNSDMLALTADIVSAHLSNNTVATTDVAGLIQSVHSALAGLGQSAEPEKPKQEPAVSVRSSVKPDYIICLEDGAKLKMLKRYIRTRFDMSPEEYRAKWGLPRDYPMVAPSYAATRKELAVKIGLGRKPVGAAVEAAADTVVSATDALKAARKRVSKKLSIVTEG
jgi:predicted transcriptional regulator